MSFIVRQKGFSALYDIAHTAVHEHLPAPQSGQVSASLGQQIVALLEMTLIHSTPARASRQHETLAWPPSAVTVGAVVVGVVDRGHPTGQTPQQHLAHAMPGTNGIVSGGPSDLRSSPKASSARRNQALAEAL